MNNSVRGVAVKAREFSLSGFTILVLMLICTADSGLAQITITLDNAMTVAMSNSPDIRRTQLDLVRTSELLKARQAQLKSRFSLTVNPFSYTSDRTFNKDFSTWSSNESKESQGVFTVSQPVQWTDGTLQIINRFNWQDSYSDFRDVRNKEFFNNMFVSFTQPIFTYNRTKLETRELELDLENTELTFAIQELLLERQVAQSFYTAYENKMNYDIAIEEMQNQDAGYQIIKNKVDAGLSALEELYQAELNLASSKSTVQNRLVGLENSLDNLKLLIGLPLGQEIAVAADVTEQDVVVDLRMAVESALQRRQELRQRKINIEEAIFALTRTAAQNEFKGAVTLSYGFVGTNEQIQNIYSKPTKQQTVGISFDIPLWDWGEKKSRLRAGRASIERQELSFDDDVNNITIKIRQAHRELQNLRNQIEIARQNVRNAQLTFEINLERYEYGDLTSMDLNLFQEQLSQKKTQLISAQVNYKLAILDLKIRSLWDFELNQPVIP
jgi:outer membrane protein